MMMTEMYVFLPMQPSYVFVFKSLETEPFRLDEAAREEKKKKGEQQNESIKRLESTDYIEVERT